MPSMRHRARFNRLWASPKANDVIRFDAEGLQRTEIARRLDIGVASVYRVLAEAKKGSATKVAA